MDVYDLDAAEILRITGTQVDNQAAQPASYGKGAITVRTLDPVDDAIEAADEENEIDRRCIMTLPWTAIVFSMLRCVRRLNAQFNRYSVLVDLDCTNASG